MSRVADRVCTEAVEAFLLAVGDDPLHAWAQIDAAELRAAARRADALDPDVRARLPLFGTLIGIKDNFDTADLATSYGSPIYEGHRPAVDAAAVDSLRRAGALIAGKTALAEFASMQPPATLSPIDPERTPGGSSTGSAVAVAAGHVPLATGTQTAGSINRPASYCGVIGYKPTFGLIPTDGIKPLAPSLDTAGVLGRDVWQVAVCAGVMAGRDLVTAAREAQTAQPRPRVAFARTPLWEQVDPESRQVIKRVAGLLADEELELPEWWGDLVSDQATLQLYEGARALQREREHHGDQLSETLKRILDAGAALTPSAQAEALRARTELGPELISSLEQYDAVLTPSATGVPPLGTHTTGDPLFNRAWNLIGAPSISLPLAWTDFPRLPVGVQLVGAPHRDAALLAAAVSLTVSA
jgi:Asp-tRNA(Asn)/Glu-tRNA(Gln) amidotransferase A subunit family amidase